MNENAIIEKFVNDQLSVWPLAAANFRMLKSCNTKSLDINGLRVQLQHNPERIRSSAANTDKSAIKARKCFLCEENRMEGQRKMRFEGRKGRIYHILVNPFPIFPYHLVIARDKHVEQSIWNRYVDMADLAHHYTDYTIFYNGPRCGASAPDHFHFQACPRHSMPLENEIDRIFDKIASHPSSDRGVPDGEEIGVVPAEIASEIDYISSVQEAQLYKYKHFANGIFVLRARTSKSLAKLFYKLLDSAPIAEGDKEPMFNLFTWYSPLSSDVGKRPAGNTHGLADFEYRSIVVFRTGHRSHHYFSEGEDHLTMSPGCADMGGLFIVPEHSDYEKLNERLLSEMVSEVTISKEAEKSIIWRMTRPQTKLNVGIVSADEITFEIISDGAGKQKVRCREGKIDYNGSLYDELYFEARTMSTMFAEPTFILYDVKIGIDFHWERYVTQKFAGGLKFIVENNKVVAVNIIGVEDYLLSVISSEMKSTASLEFLKAHAVISRSWVMSQIKKRKQKAVPHTSFTSEGMNSIGAVLTQISNNFIPNKVLDNEQVGNEYIRWFDRENHKLFDVCADDHCQRYQGLGMAIGENVRKAIDETWGQVLLYENDICDARFSKCCGGVSEKFSSCWEDKDYPYLQALPDTENHIPGKQTFCDTSDTSVLTQVLNDYDLETKDFYKWRTEYGVEELSELFARRSGFDIGRIKELEPLERGESGRIVKMKAGGEKGSIVIGKELIIRKFLSESHLKSSAFEIHWKGDDRLVLEGRGWGHGVGLCQIGAAVMASKGYNHFEILEHYYPGTKIERL